MRRRIVMLVVAAVAAATAALVPAPARAAVTNGGPLGPGVATTALVGPNDSVSYDLTVPAGARVSLVASSVPAGMTVGTAIRFSSEPFSRSGGNVMEADRTSWYTEFSPAQNTAAGSTAQLSLSCQSCFDGTVPPQPFTFTVYFATDVTRAVTSGDVVDLTFPVPGTLARLTLPDGTGSASVWLEDSQLSATIPNTTGRPIVVTDPTFGIDLFSDVPGHFRTFFSFPGPQTLLVRLPWDSTGTIRLRVNAPPSGTTPLEYGATSDTSVFFFDGQGTAKDVFFEGRPGAATLLHVAASSLQHADGTPGSATAQLLRPGSPAATLGTVGRSPATFVLPELGLHEGATVRFVPDGDTTGGLSLYVRLDPGPTTPIGPGASTLTAPAGTGRVGYGLQGTAGGTLELAFDPAVYSDPGTTGSLVTVVSEFGETVGAAALSSTSPTQLLVPTSTTGRYDVFLDQVPAGDVSVRVLVFTARTMTTTATTTPFDQDVTLDAPGTNAEVVVPVTQGQTYLVSVADVSLSGGPAGQPPAAVTVVTPEGFSSPAQPLAAGGSVFQEVGPVGPFAGDTLRVVVDGAGAATGAVRVTVATPSVATGRLPADTPTVLTVTELGGIAKYTFDAVAGQSFAFDIDRSDLTSAGFPFENLQLQRPDGSLVWASSIFNGSRSWVDPTAIDQTGTWTLVADPFGDTVGSVTVTRITPKVTTSAIAPGATRTLDFTAPGEVKKLTFTGRAGQRPVLSFTDVGVFPRVQLIGPNGLSLMDNSPSGFNPFMEAPVLTQSGTWTIVLDPDEFFTGSLGLTLSLLTDPVRAVESGQRVTTTIVGGQNPTFTVQAKAGRTIGVQVTSALVGDTGGFVVVKRPDGSVALNAPLPPSGWVELPTPTDVSGRWSVVVDPIGAAAGRITTVVWVAQDKVLTGRVGKTTSVAVDTPAQNVVMPFDVTTTKYLQYTVDGSTFRSGALLRVVTPFGTTWATAFVPPGGGTTSGTLFFPLFFTGTWSVVVDPLESSTGKAKVTFALVDQPF